LIIGTAYFPVAFGSPGPLDKKIPCGLSFIISIALVEAGTTIMSVSNFDNEFNMLFLMP